MLDLLAATLKKRMAILPAALAGAAGLVAWSFAVVQGMDRDWVTMSFLIVAGLLAGASAFFYRRNITEEHQNLLDDRVAAREQQNQLERLRSEVEEDAAEF